MSVADPKHGREHSWLRSHKSMWQNASYAQGLLFQPLRSLVLRPPQRTDLPVPIPATSPRIVGQDRPALDLAQRCPIGSDLPFIQEARF